MKGVVILFVIALLFLSILPAFDARPAQEETKAEEARRRDRRHTAIWSRGTYAAQMCWDRKTVVMTEDGRIVLEQIYSPNKRCYAKADLSANRTTVFGRVGQGRIYRQFELWSMDGCHEMLALTNDGERLVTGFNTEGRAILGSHPDLVILTVFEKGKMVREMRLRDLLPDDESLPEVDSLGVWGRYRRINPAGYYIIETIGNETVLFNVEKGEIAGVSLGEKGNIDNWHRHVDVFNWFELQYPDDCMFKEDRDFEDYPTGNIYLWRKDTGWSVRADMERIDNYQTDRGDRSSFLDFAIHMSEIMHSADGPTSSHYVDSVISQVEFTNPNGIDVVELTLSMVRAEWNDEERIEERSERTVFAALLASGPDVPRRVLFLRPSYGSEQQVESNDILKRIVDTIRYPE